MEQASNNNNNALATIIIVALIIILGVIFFKNNKVIVEPVPEDGMTQEEFENMDTSNDQPEISEDNDPSTIESELNATSFNELEADINSFEF